MQVSVVARRRKDEWRGALVVDGVFQDALIQERLSDLVIDAIGPVLAVEYPQDQEIEVVIRLSSPKQADDGSRKA